MVRALALPLTAGSLLDAAGLARQVIVLACAAALILAGPVLPF